MSKDDFMLGFEKGFMLGMQVVGRNYSPETLSGAITELGVEEIALMQRKKPKRKVRRSSKAKLLDKMTKPIWNKYKKGSGKKTYVQIRAQVSRSQKYKRAVKRL